MKVQADVKAKKQTRRQEGHNPNGGIRVTSKAKTLVDENYRKML